MFRKRQADLVDTCKQLSRPSVNGGNERASSMTPRRHDAAHGRCCLRFLIHIGFFSIVMTVLYVNSTQSLSNVDEGQRLTAVFYKDTITNTQDKSTIRSTTEQIAMASPAEPFKISNNLDGDSSTTTVMGMAAGYDLSVYEQFVGTLRKTGYKGHIILGVSPDVPLNVLAYFRYRNVTPKILQYVNCTYSVPPSAGSKKEEDETDPHVKERNTCAYPYDDIKLRWSRFPLARDWLADCKTCTGPVLIMDVRDSYFQLDPFGPGSPPIDGLQVYQEYETQTTMHWLAKWPIETCKGVVYDKPMLCSGTTTGTRDAMLQYLDAMYQEMRKWIKDPKCWFPINGDDQSIHNYLFYSGQLPFAKSVPMLTGRSIVNTVGVLGAQIAQQHAKELKEQYQLEQGEAMGRPFRGAHGNKWCGEYTVCDEAGFFIEQDGSRSRVIHQFDRYGRPFIDLWMKGNQYFQDPMPTAAQDT